MLAPAARFLPRCRGVFIRSVASLSSNPSIKVFSADESRASFLLSYLEDEPPNQRIAIGFSTRNPPTPQSFIENRTFTKILYEVLAEHAHEDKDLIAQAAAFAGPGGATLGSGGAFFAQRNKSGSSSKAGGSGAAGASGQGGRGGFFHLSDSRNPPYFGRIAWPEDILGSIEVDPSGNIIGKLEPSRTYRIITNEGILGLSPFLTEKLKERLRLEDQKDKAR